MKILSILMIVLTSSGALLAAEPAKKKALPDFTKLLPQEVFFNKQEMPVGFTYGYATNLSFDEIKAKVLKSLGKDWNFEDVSEDDFQLLEKSMNREGMVLLAASELKHPKFAHLEIGVTFVGGFKELSEKFDKKFMLSLVIIDKKKAEAYAKKKAEAK